MFSKKLPEDYWKDIYSKHGLGPEKASQITPLKWLETRNILMALHSDFTMAPAQPLLQMWIAVNRRDKLILRQKKAHSVELC